MTELDAVDLDVVERREKWKRIGGAIVVAIVVAGVLAGPMAAIVLYIKS